MSKLKVRQQFLKLPVLKGRYYKHGNSQGKTEYSDLEDSAKTRCQNGQRGWVFRCSQLYVLPIQAYTLSEVLAPSYRTWAAVAGIHGKIANCLLKAVKGTP
jgi:hypothetical protein